MTPNIFEPPLVVVQGITGNHGSFHTAKMLASGTKVVAGVTPGRGGEHVHNVPVFDNVKEAVRAQGVRASVIFVPADSAKSAIFEAIDAGIKIIVCVTEGIPTHDMLEAYQKAKKAGAIIVGPDSPGFVVPGSHNLGTVPNHITFPGQTAIISRSGTLTYELAHALSAKGIGQRLVMGIGGDLVQGVNFTDALDIAEKDPQTKQIVLVGEIGGQGENIAADHVASGISKPVYGLVVGRNLPLGQVFGHAGAVIGNNADTATAKTDYMAERGIKMSQTLDELIQNIRL